MHEREQQVLDFVRDIMERERVPYTALIHGRGKATLIVEAWVRYSMTSARVRLGNFRARKSLTPVLAKIKRVLDLIPFDRIRDDVAAYEERQRMPKLTHEEMERLLA